MVEEHETKPRIVVVGVGGAGTNAVDNMDASGMHGVEFIAVNTDLQSLEMCRTEHKIHIGSKVTLGLGTGANPLLGEQAAEEDRAVIAEVLEGADLVFITCGLGGGTGTGASPVIAEVAREMGALTVAICTKPFDFEGTVRRRHAERGQRELRAKVDTLITVPNQRLENLVDERTTLVDAFKIADSVLTQCVQSIADLITQPGLINLDFSDIRAIMNQQGGAVMGVGHGEGEGRALQAFQQASSSPLMEEVVIEGAKGILINVTCGSSVTLHELSRAMEEQIHPKADPDANIIFGVVLDESFGDGMQVTILATGFDNEMPETDIAERPSHEARSYGSEDSAFDRPAYLAKGDNVRSSYVEEEHEEEEATVAAEPTPPKGRRLGRLGERSDVLPAIFGTGL
jgi:cell division protein FtsZ